MVDIKLRDTAGNRLRQIGNYRAVVLLRQLRIIVDFKAQFTQLPEGKLRN